MKWVINLVLICLAVTVILFALLFITVSTPAGAAWALEKTLRATIDARIEVGGNTKIEIWPQISVRSEQITIVPAPDTVSSTCLSGSVDKDPVYFELGSLSILMDWAQLWKKHLYLPVVLIDGLSVNREWSGFGHAGSAGSGAASDAKQIVEQLEASIEKGWRLQIDELAIQDVQIVQCVENQSPERLVYARQAHLGIDLKAHETRRASSTDGQFAALSGSLEFAFDNVRIDDSMLRPTVANWLQENHYLTQDELHVDIARGRWALESGIAELDSLLLVGAGPNIELVRGSVNLIDETLSFLFELDTRPTKGALKVPGVDIILRQSKLPLLIEGSWFAPFVHVGRD